MDTPRTSAALLAAMCMSALLGAGCAPEASTQTGHWLSLLDSPDPAARAAAQDALVEAGPSALFQICPFIQRRLADPQERAWRAALAVEERIAAGYQDDPHLDDYYDCLQPVELPVTTIALPGGAAMEFVRIPAGTFIQGSTNPGTGIPAAEDMPCGYAPVRKVTISRPFWLARDEVSQRQWQAVMGFNRSREKRPHLPVERVSWDECVEFCRRLSRLQAPREFALPTEAQWEYACRAGGTGRHAFGNRRLLRTDQRLAEGGPWYENRFGLRRMHDGVFEWCLDWFAVWSESAATDPAGPRTGQYKSIRSNYTYCSAAECRAAHRVGFPAEPRHGIGFRPVMEVRQRPAAGARKRAAGK